MNEINILVAVKWINLKQFCHLTGFTEMAVRKKHNDGKWSDQIVKTAKDGLLYINIEEYQKWIEQA